MVQNNQFVSVSHDIIEQRHRNNDYDLYSDYLMFVQLSLEPDSFQVIKVSEKSDQ